MKSSTGLFVKQMFQENGMFAMVTTALVAEVAAVYIVVFG
jgi:hypothetical protein